MRNFFREELWFVLFLSFTISSCAPTLMNVKENSDVIRLIPKEYPQPAKESIFSDEKDGLQKDASKESAPEKISIATNWKTFFVDNQLSRLIDTALKSNQELNIITQEITIANNEIMARQGEYLPKIGLGAKAGLEKVGQYTSQGVSDATSQYAPGKTVPEKLPLYSLGLNMTWEIDIWKKLRNATKSAVLQYLATIDGKNFMVTNLVAEVANTYYELMSLDKQLEIVKNNIQIQQEALELVRLQKQAARVTSLAINRFEAEVLKNRSRQFELQQKVVQTENKLNFLTGRLPQHIARNSENFINLVPKNVHTGVPTQLLSNRPDVRQAERMLEAAKLNVQVARARFYPSLSLEAGAGYESFNSKHFLDSPGSVFYNIAGNLTAPLINRMAIKADYFSANAKQIRAVYDYERSVINAYTDVVNQLSMIQNMQKTYSLKSKQVKALTDAVDVSLILFKAARADYVEVLMTRRDALDAQMELVEIKKQLMVSFVNLYKSLGGGWQN